MGREAHTHGAHGHGPHARRGRGERGTAMLMALVVVLILALLTIALANVAVTEYSTAAALDRSLKALIGAEGAGEALIAFLRTQADWTNLATTGGWTNGSLPAALRQGTLPGSDVSYEIRVRHLSGPGYDPAVNILARVVGEARGQSRAVEFLLHRVGPADFIFYSVDNVDICSIAGGGSLQFHGSAYFQADLCLKGGAESGFYNDRPVSTAHRDANGNQLFLNHLYVQGNLDGTGNPSIGTASQHYFFLHVAGTLTNSNKFFYDNFDRNVKDPFYPAVVQIVAQAASNPANAGRQQGTQMELAICEYNPAGNTWAKVYTPNLSLQAGKVFYLPRPTVETGYWLADTSPCPNSGTLPDAVRASSLYALYWDGRSSPASGTSNLVIPVSDRPIYVPGKVLHGQNVRFEGKGQIVAANQPGAGVRLADGTRVAVAAQSTCAWNLDDPTAANATGNDCGDSNNAGYWVRAKVSPCRQPPGPGPFANDNPASTFVRRYGANAAGDVVVFVVNGSAGSRLNANACDQEMNLMAVVGDAASSAGFRMAYKLQWYGVLMTRQMRLGQVPDFWQMPDTFGELPGWMKNILLGQNSGVVRVERWRELF
ncbi:MAG: hypothetical protein QN187_06600 [Armatimonadota bacterium]|nr:hypothetical protein [Armatimonadota bacterium]